MMQSVQFNISGHDYFIDFLKAFCIISVILAHNIPDQKAVLFCLWGGMQVPLFLCVQSFHSLKKKHRQINVKKIFKRIVIPFAIVQVLLLIYALCMNGEQGVLKTIKSFISGGGFGPGSYYFWIYLQFALLLFVLGPIFSKWSKQKLLLTFVCVGMFCEIFCSVVHLPEYIYRLLSVRYLFLLYLGFLWVKEGVVMNTCTWVLAIVSMLAVLFFAYSDCNLEPLFYQTNWKTHRWICYFYASNLLTFLLYKLYQLIEKCKAAQKVLIKIGMASYEIYSANGGLFYFPEEFFFIYYK